MLTTCASVEFPLGATHQRALLRAALHTTGPILEYGAGFYSTPLLYEVARAEHRPFMTVEKAPEWAAFARRFDWEGREVIEGDYAVVRDLVRDRWPHWGLVLLDHDDNDRVAELPWFRDCADVVVYHDLTLPPGPHEGYAHTRCDMAVHPNTTLLSMTDHLDWAIFP